MSDKFDELAKNFAKSLVRRTESPFRLTVLVGFLGSVLAGQMSAQTFRTLLSFSPSLPFTNGNGVIVYTNSDGVSPNGLILSGNTLYGTASVGGSSGNGTVFKLNRDGTGFTVLYSFSQSFRTNSDGANPNSGLILSGNTLYGTAQNGGRTGSGTVFKLNTDGAGFTNLQAFAGPLDGWGPYAGLVLSSNTLYGTTVRGGTWDNGTVFALNTDGTSYRTLHSFGDWDFFTSFTNSDGAWPSTGLVFAGNTLYGMTPFGGDSGFGTVFAIKTDGTGFTTVHAFTFDFNGAIWNAENDSLVLSGNTLYGTTDVGNLMGPEFDGTVFTINTDGKGFNVLHIFSGGLKPSQLVLLGNTLYGAASVVGPGGDGTVFAMNANGTGFALLHSFTATAPYFTNSDGVVVYTNSDGIGPWTGLILSDNTLYGTTSGGGSFGNGTVFSISLPPQLTISPTAGNIILTWPTNFTGFTLQSTTNLVSPVWTTNLAPVVIRGQNTVISPIAFPQQFFRLSQ